MEMYQNILVIIDPTTDEQKALKRAVDLASRIHKNNNTAINITAFFSIFDFSYEMTTILSHNERDSMRQMVIDEKQKWLDEIIAEIAPNTQVTSKVVWHNRPYEAIINQVIEHNFDLVIKGTHQHDKFKSVVFTPTDWHILRKCPCPVLLVKDHEWPKNGNILAALNIGSDESEHSSLNSKITKQAKQLTGVVDGNLHLVNSYPGTPINIAIEVPEFDATEYNAVMLKHHQEAMNTHAEQFGVELTNTHIGEGLPETVIEEFARKLDAELVVLGTIGRTGISAALIGNTAEHVIDQLNCDVLALKPDGYISPLAN
ncbi:universal stress protein UspE [Colwellia sp. D2M02]|uniref:universal stress protein UspE n=1 Tax=Colwellia sp. D2M02 TaxID=2841562 RepID=UPI001C089A04|nr:universal stress protein UspE [Colwellia sp. D2M02]MBU2892970.1 universal stress protein UspE [Colwellia sp. D2M02]